jgi:hypothetical protein
MDITLSQVVHSDCELKLSIDSYAEMPEMSKALAAGMTPIVSYWSSADMLWMDGKGADGQGSCATDSPDDCGKRMKFSNFSVAAIPGSMCKATLTNQQPAEPDSLENTTTTTATLLAAGTATTGNGGFKVVGTLGLGYLAGFLSMSIVFVVMGYIRSTRSQQIPERPAQQTLPHSMTSSHSLVSLALVTEQQERGQQQA